MTDSPRPIPEPPPPRPITERFWGRVGVRTRALARGLAWAYRVGVRPLLRLALGALGFLLYPLWHSAVALRRWTKLPQARRGDSSPAEPVWSTWRRRIEWIKLRALTATAVFFISLNSLIFRVRMSHDNGILARGRVRLLDDELGKLLFLDPPRRKPGEAPPAGDGRGREAGPGAWLDCRLRHASVSYDDDGMLVVRGAALKVYGPAGEAAEEDPQRKGRIDFLMNTGESVVFNNARTFVQFMLLTIGGRRPRPSRRFYDRYPALWVGLQGVVRRDPDSFAALRYYSKTPLRLRAAGDALTFVKFRLIPCLCGDDGSTDHRREEAVDVLGLVRDRQAAADAAMAEAMEEQGWLAVVSGAALWAGIDRSVGDALDLALPSVADSAHALVNSSLPAREVGVATDEAWAEAVRLAKAYRALAFGERELELGEGNDDEHPEEEREEGEAGRQQLAVGRLSPEERESAGAVRDTVRSLRDGTPKGLGHGDKAAVDAYERALLDRGDELREHLVRACARIASRELLAAGALGTARDAALAATRVDGEGEKVGTVGFDEAHAVRGEGGQADGSSATNGAARKGRPRPTTPRDLHVQRVRQGRMLSSPGYTEDREWEVLGTVRESFRGAWGLGLDWADGQDKLGWSRDEKAPERENQVRLEVREWKPRIPPPTSEAVEAAATFAYDRCERPASAAARRAYLDGMASYAAQAVSARICGPVVRRLAGSVREGLRDAPEGSGSAAAAKAMEAEGFHTAVLADVHRDLVPVLRRAAAALLEPELRRLGEAGNESGAEPLVSRCVDEVIRVARAEVADVAAKRLAVHVGATVRDRDLDIDDAEMAPDWDRETPWNQRACGPGDRDFDPTAGPGGRPRDRNYLKRELRERIWKDGVRYVLQVQRRDWDEGDGREVFDPARPWDRARFPWRNLAEVELTEALTHEESVLTQFSLTNLPDCLETIPAVSIDDPPSLDYLRISGLWARRVRRFAESLLGPRARIPDERPAVDRLRARWHRGSPDSVWVPCPDGTPADEMRRRYPDARGDRAEARHKRQTKLAVRRSEYRWASDGRMPPHAAELPPHEDFDREEKRRMKRQRRKVAALTGWVYVSDRLRRGPPTRLAHFDEYYNPLLQKKPEVAWRFRHDHEFGRQRVAGVNPVMIERCTKEALDRLVRHQRLPRLLPEATGFRRLLGEDGTIARAAESERLYIVDYGLIGSLSPRLGSYLAAPICLLYAEPGREGRLLPVAIQLHQGLRPESEGGAAERLYDQASSTRDLQEAWLRQVFHPRDGQDWSWQLAKTFVQAADAVYHEAVSHLLDTHLVSEVFAVAMWRNLSEHHPVHALLRPHFRFTMAINHVARNELLATGGAIDDVFATGVEVAKDLCRAAWREWNFREKNLERDLLRRGFASEIDGIYYPYRRDARRLWKVVERHVHEVVHRYYLSDEMVRADPELFRWIADLLDDRGGCMRGKGLPLGEQPRGAWTREALIEMLTQIIFTASVQHTAVNSGQWDMYGYIPNAPGALMRKAPDHPEDRTLDGQRPPDPLPRDWEERWFVSYLPHGRAAVTQLAMASFLSRPIERRLGEFELTRYFGGDPFVSKKALELRYDLERVAEEIRQDNLRERWAAYHYLCPPAIARSVYL